MPIRLLGTLAQTGMGVSRLHTQVRLGLDMLGLYVFFMARYCNLYGHFLFKLLFLETQPLISLE